MLDLVWTPMVAGHVVLELDTGLELRVQKVGFVEQDDECGVREQSTLADIFPELC